MKNLPTREQSTQLLQQHVQSEALRHHCYMVAEALEAYAKALGEDEELWYQTGLLHDSDYEEYPDEHPERALAEWLRDYPKELRQAVAAHYEAKTGQEPESLLDKHLLACDEISGFMHAVSLVRPGGFADMKPKSVKKKLKDKAFAANVSREDVARGLELIGKTADEHFAFLIEVFNKK